MNLGNSVQLPFLRLVLHFRVIFCLCGIQFRVGACQNPVIGPSKLPYDDFFAKGLAWGFWRPPANNISAKGKAGLHSDTMWYDREYAVRHIGQIGVLWVNFFLLWPPIGYVRYSICTANLQWVSVAIIEIWINLSPVRWCFRRRIQMEPSGGQYAGCAIALSGGRLCHIFRCLVCLIIAGQIIRIIVWLIGPWSRCGGDKIAVQYDFKFIDRHTSMFGAVFILHILQEGLLVLCCVECLVLRINIHSPVPLSKRSQLAERIGDVRGNEKHAHHWSHFGVVFGQLLSN